MNSTITKSRVWNAERPECRGLSRSRVIPGRTKLFIAVFILLLACLAIAASGPSEARRVVGGSEDHAARLAARAGEVEDQLMSEVMAAGLF